MKQLLIVGEAILASGSFVDDGENIRAYTPEGKADAIYPKHVMAGHAIVTEELPSDFSCPGYLWQGGLVKKPEVVVPKTREELKAERAEKVAAIIVTTSTGKTFDGDEDSQTRMARAILIGQATGLTETLWTLADNSDQLVTLAEITEALTLAGQRQAELWPLP